MPVPGSGPKHIFETSSPLCWVLCSPDLLHRPGGIPLCSRNSLAARFCNLYLICAGPARVGVQTCVSAALPALWSHLAWLPHFERDLAAGKRSAPHGTGGRRRAAARRGFRPAAAQPRRCQGQEEAPRGQQRGGVPSAEEAGRGGGLFGGPGAASRAGPGRGRARRMPAAQAHSAGQEEHPGRCGRRRAAGVAAGAGRRGRGGRAAPEARAGCVPGARQGARPGAARRGGGCALPERRSRAAGGGRAGGSGGAGGAPSRAASRSACSRRGSAWPGRVRGAAAAGAERSAAPSGWLGAAPARERGRRRGGHLAAAGLRRHAAGWSPCY